MLSKCHNCKRCQVLRNPCNSVFIVVQGELWTRFKGHSKGGSAGPAGWQHPATLEIAPIPSPAGKMPRTRREISSTTAKFPTREPQKLALAMAVSIAPTSTLPKNKSGRPLFILSFKAITSLSISISNRLSQWIWRDVKNKFWGGDICEAAPHGRFCERHRIVSLIKII